MSEKRYSSKRFCSLCDSTKIQVESHCTDAKKYKHFKAKCMACGATWIEVWQLKSLRDVKAKAEAERAEDWKKTRGCKQ